MPRSLAFCPSQFQSPLKMFVLKGQAAKCLIQRSPLLPTDTLALRVCSPDCSLALPDANRHCADSSAPRRGQPGIPSPFPEAGMCTRSQGKAAVGCELLSSLWPRTVGLSHCAGSTEVPAVWSLFILVCSSWGRDHSHQPLHHASLCSVEAFSDHFLGLLSMTSSSLTASVFSGMTRVFMLLSRFLAQTWKQPFFLGILIPFGTRWCFRATI